MRTEGKERQRRQEKEERKKMEAHGGPLGMREKVTEKEERGRGDMGLPRKGVELVSEGKTREEVKGPKGWRKEGEGKGGEEIKRDKEYGCFFSFCDHGLNITEARSWVSLTAHTQPVRTLKA